MTQQNEEQAVSREDLEEQYEEQRATLKAILLLWLGIRLVYTVFECYLSVTMIRDPLINIIASIVSLGIYALAGYAIYRGRKQVALAVLGMALFGMFTLLKDFDILSFRVYSSLIKAYIVIMGAVILFQIAVSVYVLVSPMLKPYFEEIKELERER